MTKVRRELGRQLAREHPVPLVADGDPPPVIIPIPESAAHATLGFHQESVAQGRPCTLDLGFFRNPYVGRSFISPSQELRDLKVLCKFNPMEHVLKGKTVRACSLSLCLSLFLSLVVSLLASTPVPGLRMRRRVETLWLGQTSAHALSHNTTYSCEHPSLPPCCIDAPHSLSPSLILNSQQASEPAGAQSRLYVVVCLTFGDAPCFVL